MATAGETKPLAGLNIESKRRSPVVMKWAASIKLISSQSPFYA